MTEGGDDTSDRDTDEDFGDEDFPLRWWSLTSLTDSRGLAVAALVLAAISLLGIEAGHEIATALEFTGHPGVHGLAVIDGIQAGVAVLAVGLGLFVIRGEWYAEEASWAGWLARAAIVVGALAFVIDVVGLIFVLSTHIQAPTSDGAGALEYHLQP